MKRFIFAAFLCGMVLVCLIGSAFSQDPAKPDWKAGFRAHDKNGDGSIDRAEFHDWMVDAYFHKDINHKGYLIFEDVKDVMSPETFRTYDKSGDGKLRLKEFLNSVFMDFGAMDVDKNGLLTLEETETYIHQKRK